MTDRTETRYAWLTVMLRPNVKLLAGTALAFGLLGCASHPPQRPAPPEQPAAVAAPVRQVTFNLHDAKLDDVLRAFASASGTPVVVADDAQPIARCARLSLLAPEPVPVERVERLVVAAVQTLPLTVEVRDEGWLIRRGQGDPPEECRHEAAAPPEVPTPPDPVERPPVDFADDIQQVSSHTYEVNRRVIDDAVENQTTMMRSARFVPDQHDGKIVGIRVFGIRPGSLLGVLGFRNGDRIERVAGVPISSPDRALEAYVKIREADRVEVDVVRRGRPVRLTYVVVQ